MFSFNKSYITLSNNHPGEKNPSKNLTSIDMHWIPMGMLLGLWQLYCNDSSGRFR